MSDWKERLAAELAELDARIDKLTAFARAGWPGASPTQRRLMAVQLGAMLTYIIALEVRLADARETPPAA